MRQTSTILTLAFVAVVSSSSMQQNARASLYVDAPDVSSARNWAEIGGDSLAWHAPLLEMGTNLLEAYGPPFDENGGDLGRQASLPGSSDQTSPATVPSQPVGPSLPSLQEASRPEVTRPPARVARQPRVPIVRIAFSSSVLGPMAHTKFCLDYPSECKVRKIQFRSGTIKLTPQRRAELVKINAKVNRAIRSDPNTAGLAAEKWLVAPQSGECHDYAVTKRHDLIARGWPSRALLLAEVIVPSGEHHLVLVIRTNEGDLVADNLNGNIRNWSKIDYQWVRIQTPANPMYWATLSRTTVYAQLD